ncbi:hypothetical protein R2R29_20355 [Vibrio diabolicus]|uniref:hypothetical protein n=1 Tax=Vibrio diabolicus TaxID=50719 RepID=UPI00294100CE|nr:hypothetical protein [Vibrio diabolicus]MDV5086800.1 hypothetical protein [Vibrio diabolicus]
MTMVLEAAAAHSGTAVVEILQNCVIFNDKVHEPYNGPANRSEHLLYLSDNEPLLFGKTHSKALNNRGFGFEIVESEAPNLLLHSSQCEESYYAYALANLSYPDFPVPVGVFRSATRPTFDQVIRHQKHQATLKYGQGDLTELLKQNSYERLC